MMSFQCELERSVEAGSPAPSLKRDQAHISGQLSGHVHLLAGPPATKRPAPSPGPVSSCQLLQGIQSAGSSPGYHSAGSSPSSSAASPVSSSSPGACAHQGGTQSQNNQNVNQNQNSHQGLSHHQQNQSPDAGGTKQVRGLLDLMGTQDGLTLSWFHDANTHQRLALAIASNRIMVSGDISLAEMSRYPVPIMAKPPLGVSDLTLENWLQKLIQAPVTSQYGPRGLKLTFTSTRTVEPAFRVLARHAEQIRGPLILNADILAPPTHTPPAASTKGAGRGQSQASSSQQLVQQPVDAWTFLMLCRTRFPKCIISIGWCTPVSSLGQTELPSTGAASPQSSDSMFELDLMEAPGQPADQLQQLNQQLSRLQHQLQLQHPYPMLVQAPNQIQARHFSGQQPTQSSQSTACQQQLYAHLHMSAVAAANQHHHQLNQLLANQHLLSSAASLASQSGSSSSGHSSGSPSPTSPIGHLLSPQQLLAAAAHLEPSSNGNELTGLGLGAMAAAAASVAASSGTYQQLPLNLNINETDSSGHLKGYQSQLTARLHHNLSNTPQKPQSSANRIQTDQRAHLNLGHVQKKAALSSATNSSNPLPQNLLLKTTNSAALSSGSTGSGSYTREMIDKMASLVKEYNLTQPVTFPVRARWLKSSLAELQRLLYQVGSNSTLTVIAQQEDLISVDELLAIRKSFAANQLLFDLPDELAASLRLELASEPGATSTTSSSSSVTTGPPTTTTTTTTAPMVGSANTTTSTSTSNSS